MRRAIKVFLGFHVNVPVEGFCGSVSKQKAPKRAEPSSTPLSGCDRVTTRQPGGTELSFLLPQWALRRKPRSGWELRFHKKDDVSSGSMFFKPVVKLGLERVC